MPSLPIVTHQQRLSRDGVKLQIWGGPKIGKTRLAATCDPATTLYVDCERGMQSLRDWPGNSIAPTSWLDAKLLTAFICGPAYDVFDESEDYSASHFNAAQLRYGDRSQLSQYRTIFIDSTTIISQWAMAWASAQPDAKTKSGAPDTRGMYGLLSRQLTAWAWRWQNVEHLNVVLIGGIKQDDANRWVPMVDGGAALKFPYIFDIIATLHPIPQQDPMALPVRGLVCQSPNPWHLPAGGRFSCLAPIEQPHIENLFAKVVANS